MHYLQQIEESKREGIRDTCKLYCTKGLSAVTLIALFIIGCTGAAGKIHHFPIGWVATGLGVGGYILHLAYGKLEERKFELITLGCVSSMIVFLGVLGGAKLLSAKQVGWGIVGTLLLTFLFYNCLEKCVKNHCPCQDQNRYKA